MKELTVEEKAKRYDEAYKKVSVRFGSNVADEIFFKEDEDERIRKELLSFFIERAKYTEDSTFNGLSSKEIIAWLEKQSADISSFTEKQQVFMRKYTGLYFQWGDTQGYTADQVGKVSGKKYFGWADYKYGNGTSSPGATGMTKYNSTDGKTVLDAEDDAVQVAWGGKWRMPTTEEFNTLSATTTSVWTDNYEGSEVKGRVFVSKNDNSKVLFFPAFGRPEDGQMSFVGRDSLYWSSSLNIGNVIYANNFYAYDGGKGVLWTDYHDRNVGLLVRGVLDA